MDPPQEIEQGGGVMGDTKVRPRGEVELTHLPHLLRVHLTWIKDRNGSIKLLPTTMMSICTILAQHSAQIPFNVETETIKLHTTCKLS